MRSSCGTMSSVTHSWTSSTSTNLQLSAGHTHAHTLTHTLGLIYNDCKPYNQFSALWDSAVNNGGFVSVASVLMKT